MNKYFKNFIALSFVAISVVSCTKNLDRKPSVGLYADGVYTDAAGYKTQLAKVYSAFALTGKDGPGSSDLGGIDAGTSDFFRLFWNAQQLTTDESICAWGDPGVPDFHNLNWTSSNVILNGLYNRSLYQIVVANSFLKEAAPDKVAGRGISGADADNISQYAAEARYLRAYQYWVLMDLFGNPPFVTEADPIGSFLPKQISRADLFTYIETELKAIESSLADARTNEYGRADKGACWALLARLYLNAEVYTGTDRSADAIIYSQKVIDAGYQLMANYRELFYADNNIGNTEVILPINFDGQNTQNYGGTTFLVNSAINGDMDPSSFGVPNGGWGGNRSTENLPNQFSDISGTTDTRANFFGTKLQIDDVSKFTDGLRITKFRNINKDLTLPPNAGTFCSVDFPIFRLAEMYLINAEAVLRTGGNQAAAVADINTLRERAYGNTTGNIATITLDEILSERSRELYWEGFRRTDLIRFGKFTSSEYLWPWKGGIKDGTGVDNHYQLFPIPSTDLIANPNLTQNQGY